MVNQRFIKIWTAVSLSLLLFLGILPKAVAHEWITGHEHVVTHPSQHLELSTAGNVLTCNCEEVPFLSPFEITESFELPAPATAYPVFSHTAPQDIASVSLYPCYLRGPPAQA